ncbi:single-stranded DNA-binding protein [Candidatus Chloroploca asiatica]|uniref:Single-stranded DNA-binding protein n=1 Tax=Candidatus Chloroploca asiatica TaxID=1506545 RepID=A0A2H3KR28_9CHLR|nr:single-stranded DNA-binding protein [Candidatus Chloroploca asiatica]PDW00938.1 hypothetical protein A9Q02_21470 [Candidatus Chloroploca asiatica]
MGNRDLNKMMLTGQIEAEPEMHFTGAGEPRTTLYVRCAGARDATLTERVRLVAWGSPLAERCNDLLPGMQVLVEGQLQRCTADDPAEQARFPLEVRVRSYLVLDPGDAAAAVLVPVSPRPPAPPTRTMALPPARPTRTVAPPPRSNVPPAPARPPLPMQPPRATDPRPTIASPTDPREPTSRA